MSARDEMIEEALKRKRKGELIEASRRMRDGDDVPEAERVYPGDDPGDSFPPQWDYITSPALRNIVKNSRRSGKTEGKIRRAQRFGIRGKNVLYVGRILKNVRHQFWTPLKDRLSRFGVGHKAEERDLVLRFTDGPGMIMGMSADDVKDIEKGRGYRWDLAMIDEAQSFPDDVLEPLIDYILIPTLIDRAGALDLGGTPPDPNKGEHVSGYFVRLIREAMKNVSKDPREGWRLHEWTIFDNPHIPAENVRQAYAARGIGPGHPVWEAEVMGRLVINPANRVLPFEDSRNTYEALP